MKKKSLFYKIYFSVIAVFLVLLVVSLFVLNSWLKAYESAQPVGFVNNVITNYIEKREFDKLTKDYNISLSIYESDDLLNSAFEKIVADKKLSVSSSGRKLEGFDETFNIKADDDVFMTLYLKKSEKAGKFGIKGYTIGKAEFDSSLSKSYKINAPSDVKIVVNGVEVVDQDRKDLELPKILTDKIGEKTAVTHQSFTLSGFLTDSFEIKAFDKSGKEVAVSNENGIYVISQSIPENELNDLKTTSLNATQSYAKFMQEDAGLGEVAKYFDTSTEFYDYVRKTERFVWDHTGYEFKDVSFSEAHKYTDNIYGCRVKFVHTLKLGQKTYEDRFDKYVYLEKTANGLKVIDMQTPAK